MAIFSKLLGYVLVAASNILRYCGVASTILAGQIDPILFESLYASQHAIFLFSIIPQMWKNFSNKSTGELSFSMCLMNFGGSSDELDQFNATKVNCWCCE